jgi:hypothetical protein
MRYGGFNRARRTFRNTPEERDRQGSAEPDHIAVGPLNFDEHGDPEAAKSMPGFWGTRSEVASCPPPEYRHRGWWC